MSITKNLADVLHRITDVLPWHEEQHKLDLHSAIDAEVQTDEPDSDSVLSVDSASGVVTSYHE